MVQTMRSIKAPDGAKMEAVASRRFVCLDNPEAVDALRFRLNPDAALKLVGLQVTPQSGVRTMAADGAKLLCRNVEFSAGQRFQFAWNFMSWGDMPWNDFATFRAVPSAPQAYGRSVVLADLAGLARANSRTTGWRFATWTVSAPFSGTLEWTVANGQTVTDPALDEPNELAFTNPPALLIDDIRVLG